MKIAHKSCVSWSDVRQQIDAAEFAVSATTAPSCKPTSFPCGKSCQSAKTKTGKATQCGNSLQGQAAMLANWLFAQAAKLKPNKTNQRTLASPLATQSKTPSKTPAPQSKKAGNVTPKAGNVTPKAGNVTPKAGNVTPKPKSLTHEDLARAGEEFAKRFNLDRFNPTEREQEIFREKTRIGKMLENSYSSAAFAQKYPDKTAREKRRQEIYDKYLELESIRHALKAVREERAIAVHSYLLQAVVKHHGLTNKQVQEMVDRTEFQEDSLSKTNVSQLKKNLGDFYRLTGGKGSTSIGVVRKDRDRAYATAGVINAGAFPKMGAQAYRKTFFHEAAHHLEIESSQIREVAVDWRNGRSTSTTPEKLSDITGNKAYGDNEKAIPDKFVNPYVGKLYGKTLKEGFTEVASVGIEHFSSTKLMHLLYEKDPSHFHLSLGLLLHKDKKV